MRKSDMISRRKGTRNYYVRFLVPEHLQRLIGKKEICKTLGTPDRKMAETRAPKIIANMQADIDRTIAIKTAQPSVQPTRALLEKLARDYYQHQVDADRDERAHEPELAQERLRNGRSGNAEYVSELRKAVAVGDFRYVDAGFIAATNDLNLPEGSTLYREFQQMLMRAAIEAAQRWAELDLGHFDGEPKDKLLNGSAESESTNLSKPIAVAGESLRELFEKYARYKSAKIKPDTIDQRRKVVARFSESPFKNVNIGPVVETLA